MHLSARRRKGEATWVCGSARWSDSRRFRTSLAAGSALCCLSRDALLLQQPSPRRRTRALQHGSTTVHGSGGSCFAAQGDDELSAGWRCSGLVLPAKGHMRAMMAQAAVLSLHDCRWQVSSAQGHAVEDGGDAALNAVRTKLPPSAGSASVVAATEAGSAASQAMRYVGRLTGTASNGQQPHATTCSARERTCSPLTVHRTTPTGEAMSGVP